MRNIILLILKGFVIGCGKILPGVSGSLIALSLGVYEPAVEAISNIFNNFKKNIIYLGLLGIGILISIIIGSHIISYLLNKCYLISMFLFIGLIMGSVIDVKNKIVKKKYLITILVAVLSFYLFSIKGISEYDFNSLTSLFIIGFIDAFTMIVPGISGTAIFMLLGCYDELLYIFANMIGILFKSPFIIIILSLGLLIGIIITSNLMNYLLKNKSDLIYSIILGFSLSTAVFLFIKTVSTNFNIIEFIIGIIFLIIGCIITNYKSHKI